MDPPGYDGALERFKMRLTFTDDSDQNEATVTIMAASPSVSPRLPSPPPMAEDQLGPKSPLAATMDESGKLQIPQMEDIGAARRIRPGTRSVDMASGPPLVAHNEIDSAFQLQEHLKALHSSLTHPVDKFHRIPIDKNMAYQLTQPPEGIDRYLWLYELCRFLIQKLNDVVTGLFNDKPACSGATCPEMRASEWQYLCAVHDPPKSCTAIDYCCHTLDWATNVLTSQKIFPSRLALGTENVSAQHQIRQLTNIFRRVYRIFAHAWFQHREVFWKLESTTGMYMFFKTVCDTYNLIPEDNYTIPAEAEGVEITPISETEQEAPDAFGSRTILKRDTQQQKEEPAASSEPEPESEPVAANSTVATGHVSKRHRPTASLGGQPVPIVPEENEEEDQPKKEDSELVPEQPEEPAAEDGHEPEVAPAPAPGSLERSETAYKVDGPADEASEDASATEATESPVEETPQDAEAEEDAADDPMGSSAAVEANEKSFESESKGEAPEDTAEDGAEEAAEEASKEASKEAPKEAAEASGHADDKAVEETKAPVMDPEADAADEKEASKTVAD